VAADLVAAINGDPDLPVTAAVDGATPEQVDLTAKNAGEVGNEIIATTVVYGDERLPPGLTVTPARLQLTGGTGNPDIDPIVRGVEEERWWTEMACPWVDTYTLQTLTAWLDERWHAMTARGCMAYAAVQGTQGEMATIGETPGSQWLSLVPASKAPHPGWLYAAGVGGVCAFQTKQHPAQPLQSLTVPGLIAPRPADRLNPQARNMLLYSGISELRFDGDDDVVIARMITTYRESPFGVPDDSWLDVETAATLRACRFDLTASTELRFPRYMWADDGHPVQPGQAIIRPRDLAAHTAGRQRLWEAAGWIQRADETIPQIQVEYRDKNTAGVYCPVDVMGQLRKVGFIIAFAA
jgi:phage tail sheath gpL-like